MTAKQYLRQLRHIRGLVAAKEEKIQQLREWASLSRNSLSLDRRGGFAGDRLSAMVAKICGMETSLIADKLRLLDLEREIIGRIDAVDDLRCRKLLTLRYVNGQGWGQIAREMGYGIDHIFKLHGWALRQIENSNTI
jgi:hypothetical protein